MDLKIGYLSLLVQIIIGIQPKEITTNNPKRVLQDYSGFSQQDKPNQIYITKEAHKNSKKTYAKKPTSQLDCQPGERYISYPTPRCPRIDFRKYFNIFDKSTSQIYGICYENIEGCENYDYETATCQECSMFYLYSENFGTGNCCTNLIKEGARYLCIAYLILCIAVFFLLFVAFYLRRILFFLIICKIFFGFKRIVIAFIILQIKLMLILIFVIIYGVWVMLCMILYFIFSIKDYICSGETRKFFVLRFKRQQGKAFLCFKKFIRENVFYAEKYTH